MLRRSVFVLAHELGDRSFYPTYRRLVRDQWKPYDELRREQERRLGHLIRFSYENVPYYRALFKEQGLTPKDIRTVEDLEKIPVLTKEIIKNRWEDFKPANLSSMRFDTRATGGSTGVPLQYRVSNYDRFLSGAILYRGWGYGGYDLGDRMVFLAGTSLDVGTKPWLVQRAHEIVRNVKKISSFDMSDAGMRHYASIMNSYKPRFLTGYASSIYFFARWVNEESIAVPQLTGVFTTAERLFPNMRETIEEAFGCEVYNTYGLNDGGVTAFECAEHSGLHIDTERSIMEIVDRHHTQLAEGQGEILATSLYNFAMPFIRYSTGDIATLSNIECDCERHSRILQELIGRSFDFFLTPEGNRIHGGFFTLIFLEHGHTAKEYQLIQTAIDKIIIKVVPGKNFDEKNIENIRSIISSKSPGWHVQIEEVESIDRTSSGKFRFVINEMARNV